MSTTEGESPEHGSAGAEDHDSPSPSESVGNKRSESGSTGGSEDAELSTPVETSTSNPAEPLSDKEPEKGVSSSADNTNGDEVPVLVPGEEAEDSTPSSPVTVIESGASEHDSGEVSDSGTASLTAKAANHGIAENVATEEPGTEKPSSTVDDTGREAEEDSDDLSETSLSPSPEDSPPEADLPVQVAGRRDPVTQEDMDRAIENAQNNKDNEDKTHLKYPENDDLIPGKPISPHRRRCIRPDGTIIDAPPPFVLNTIGEGPDEQPLAEAVESSLPSSAAGDYPEAEYGDDPKDNSEDHGRPQTPSGAVDDTDVDDPFSDFTSIAAAGKELQGDADAEPCVRPDSRASVRYESQFSDSSEEEDEEDDEDDDEDEDEEDDEEDDEEHAGQDDEVQDVKDDEVQDAQGKPKAKLDKQYYFEKKGWRTQKQLHVESMLSAIVQRGRERTRKPLAPPPRRPSPLIAEIDPLDVPNPEQGSDATEAAQPESEASAVLDSDEESTAAETDQLKIKTLDSPDSDQGIDSTKADQLEPTIPSPRGLGRRVSQRNLELARERLNEVDFVLDPGNNVDKRRYPVWTNEGELQNIFDKYLSEIMNGRRRLVQSREELVQSREEIKKSEREIEEWKAIIPVVAELRRREASLDQKFDDANHEHAVEFNRIADESDKYKEKSELLQQDIEKLEMELKDARKECEKLQKQIATNSAAGPAQCHNCPRLQKEIDRLEAELLLLKSTTKTAPEGHEDGSNKLAEDVKQLQEDLGREKAISKELKDQRTFALALSTFQDGVQWPKEKRGAVAAIIVDYINSQNRDQEEPLGVEEVLDVLEQNLDIQDIARWLDKHPNRYRFKPYRLFQSILFSGEVLNLGLVAAYLSISGYMDQGQVTYVNLREYIDLFQTLREEWTENYSKIRETLDTADTDRTSMLLQLEDMEERNTRLLMEAKSQDKSAKANSDMTKELAKAKKDLSDKANELEQHQDLIYDMTGQQETDSAKIANLEAEKKELESKVEQLTKDLKGKNSQATKQVGAVDTKDSECEERVKQLEDEAQKLRNTIDEFNSQAKESDKLRGELKALNEHVKNISAQAAEASQLREEVDKLQKQNVDLNAKAQTDAKLIQELEEAKNEPKAQQGSSGSDSDDPVDKECPKKLARLTQDFETARKDHEKQVKDLHEELDHEKQKAMKKIELAEKWRLESFDLEKEHIKCAAQIADLEAKISELDAQRSENASSTDYASADGLPEKQLREVQLDLSVAHAKIKELEAQTKDLETAMRNLEQQDYQSEGESGDTSKQIEQYQKQSSDLQAIKDEHLKCPTIIAGLQSRISALEAIEAEHRRCSARISDLENNIHELEHELQSQSNDSGTAASGPVDEQMQALQRQLKRAREEEEQAQDEIKRLTAEAQRPQGHPLVGALNKITELNNQLASANGEKDIMTQMLNSAGGVQKALSARVGDLETTNRDLRARLDSTSTSPTNTANTPPANIASALQKIAELESRLASSSVEKDSLLQMVNIATAEKKALKKQVDDLEAETQTSESSAAAATATAPANIVSALQKIAELESKLAGCSGEKDSLLQMVNIATADKKALKEQIDDLKATNQDLTSNNTATAAPVSLASALQKIAELESNLAHASSEKDILLQMVNTATARQKALKERADNLEATNRKLESTKTITGDQNTRDQEIQKLKDDHETELQRLRDVHDEKPQRLQDERDSNDHSDDDQDSSRTIKNLKSQNERLSDENQGLHTDNARLEDEKKRLNTDNARLADANQDLHTDNARLKDDNKRLHTEIATASTSVKPKENVNDLKTQIKNQATELARLDRSTKDMRNQLDASGAVPSDELIALRDQVAKLTLSSSDAEKRASQVDRLNAQIRDLTAENRKLQSQPKAGDTPTSTLPDTGLRLRLRQEIARLRTQVTSETTLSKQLQGRITEVETENKALEEWSGISSIQNAHRPAEASSDALETDLSVKLNRDNVRLRRQLNELRSENQALKAESTSKTKQVDTNIGPDVDNIRARASELKGASDEFNKELDRDAAGEPHIVNEFRNFRYRMQVDGQQSHLKALTSLYRSAIERAEALERAEDNDESEESESRGKAETEGSGTAESSDKTESSGKAKSSDETEGSGEAKSSAETEDNGQSEGSGETDSSESRLREEVARLKDRNSGLEKENTDLLEGHFTQNILVVSDESEDNLARPTIDVYKKQVDECKEFFTIQQFQVLQEKTWFNILQNETVKMQYKHEQELAEVNEIIADLEARMDGTSKLKGTAKGKDKAKDVPEDEGTSEEEQPDTCEKELASAKSTIATLRRDLRVTDTRIQSLGRERDNLLRLAGDEVRNALANAKGGLASSLTPARRKSTKTEEISEDEQPGTCEEKLALARTIVKNLRVELRAAESQIRLFERGNATILRLGGDSLKNALAVEASQSPTVDSKKGKAKARDTPKDEGTPEEEGKNTCERKLAFARATIEDLRAQLKDAQARANDKTPKTPEPSGDVNGRSNGVINGGANGGVNGGPNGGPNGGLNGGPNGGANGGSNGNHTDSDLDLLQDQLDRARFTIRTLQKEISATGDPEKAHISVYLAMANQARDELRGAHDQVQKERTTIAEMHHDYSQLELRHEKVLSEINARIEQLERENAQLRRIGGERVKTAVGAAAGAAVATGAAALTSAFGRPRSPRPSTTNDAPSRIPRPGGTSRPANTTGSPASPSGSTTSPTRTTSRSTRPTSPRPRRTSPTSPTNRSPRSPRPTRPTNTSTGTYLPLNHRFRIRPINHNNPARLADLAEIDRKSEEMRRRHSDQADRQQRIDDYLLETWGVGRWRSREEVWGHVFRDEEGRSVSSRGSRGERR